MKLLESYYHLNNEFYFMAHSELKPSRLTLLFIHGLGDAHIHYLPYLHSVLAQDYNILIPDLLGYGKSSAAKDYRFQYQIAGLQQHIHHLHKIFNLPLSNFILIAHSMGGIHATLLCESNFSPNIKGFINVEGSITQYGSFIAKNMLNSLKTKTFSKWFTDFKQKNIYETLGYQSIPIRPYYAAVEFCQPDAFLNNATEMAMMSNALTGKFTNIVGKKYAHLAIPRIYCYGDTLSKETIEFLSANNLLSHYFKCKTHFLLSECFDEFITFIKNYVESLQLKINL